VSPIQYAHVKALSARYSGSVPSLADRRTAVSKKWPYTHEPAVREDELRVATRCSP